MEYHCCSCFNSRLNSERLLHLAGETAPTPHMWTSYLSYPVCAMMAQLLCCHIHPAVHPNTQTHNTKALSLTRGTSAATRPVSGSLNSRASVMGY